MEVAMKFSDDSSVTQKYDEASQRGSRFPKEANERRSVQGAVRSAVRRPVRKKQHIGRFGSGCSGLDLGLACLSAPGPGQQVSLVSVIRQEAQDYQNRPELVQSLVGKFDEQGRPGEPQDLDHALKRQQFGTLHIDFHERRAPGSLVRKQPVERHGGDRRRSGKACGRPGKAS